MFKVFQQDKPLAVLHIPKCGGTSVRRNFERWFGDRLLLHYARRAPVGVTFPVHHDLAENPRAVIYGHFNAAKGFGVQDYYPTIDQHLTIFRDPWDRSVSWFQFMKQRNHEAIQDMTLETYLSGYPYDCPTLGPTMASFMPFDFDRETIEDVLCAHFVQIGLMEELNESLVRIARALGQPFSPSDLVHINKSKASDEQVEHLKSQYRERNAQDYVLYDAARRLFDRQS